MAGDEHDRQGGIDLQRTAQHLHAVDARHADVGDDDSGEIAVEAGECRVGARKTLDRMVVELEPLRQRVTQVVVVLDQDDPSGFAHALSMPYSAASIRSW